MNPQVLEKYRMQTKLTCEELSNRMGRTPGWYSRIRTGEQLLQSQYIHPMAEVFGVKPEILALEYFSKP